MERDSAIFFRGQEQSTEDMPFVKKAFTQAIELVELYGHEEKDQTWDTMREYTEFKVPWTRIEIFKLPYDVGITASLNKKSAGVSILADRRVWDKLLAIPRHKDRLKLPDAQRDKMDRLFNQSLMMNNIHLSFNENSMKLGEGCIISNGSQYAPGLLPILEECKAQLLKNKQG